MNILVPSADIKKTSGCAASILDIDFSARHREQAKKAFAHCLKPEHYS